MQLLHTDLFSHAGLNMETIYTVIFTFNRNSQVIYVKHFKSL